MSSNSSLALKSKGFVNQGLGEFLGWPSGVVSQSFDDGT
jgi:hypothetical protein